MSNTVLLIHGAWLNSRIPDRARDDSHAVS